jgi:hypothetical protein
VADGFPEGSYAFTDSYGEEAMPNPLCQRSEGIKYRSQRLKALGNAVVPQQAVPFFIAIRETEGAIDIPF